MKQTPVQFITRTGILLALMIAVQFMKGISPWITGPLVNAILVLATLGVGIYSGAALSVLAPITAQLILHAKPTIMTGYTLILVIMLGNLIYVGSVWLATRKNNKADSPLAIGLIVGSVVKWLVMWALVAWVIIPVFRETLGPGIIATLQSNYAVLQIGAAILGSVLAFLVWMPLRKALRK